MKKFICSKDCIEACFAHIDGLSIIPENRENTGRFVCSKLGKFLQRELFSSDLSFINVNGKQEHAELHKIIKSITSYISVNKDKNILFIRGSGSLGYMMTYWDLLFSHFPNIYFVDGSLCLETGESAHIKDFGVYVNPPVENLSEVDNIVLFGRDAHNVSPHLYSYLKKLKNDGKKIIYIDPILRKTVRISDRYIRIKPASDNFLAAAIIKNLSLDDIPYDLNYLIEKCNVSENDLSYLVDTFKNGKTGIITGYGLQRYKNGENIVRWINRLAYFTNNLNYLYYVRSSKAGLPKPDIKNPTINISEILTCLNKGFFHGGIIVASNPLISYPSSKKLEELLKKLNFLLVVDTNKTETAEIATHFIKVYGMFAQEDISGSYFYDNRLHKRDKVFDKLSDVDVIKAISKELEVNIDIKFPPIPEKKEYETRKYKTNSLQLLENKSEGLRLITGSHYSYLNSQRFGDFVENFIYISPIDAQKYNLRDEEVVNISNENGTITGKVKISEMCGEGYLFCYKCQNLMEGHPNILTSYTPTDSFTGIALYDTFVQLEKQKYHQ